MAPTGEEEEGREGKRQKTAGCSASSHPVAKGTGDGAGDGTAGKSGLSCNGGSGNKKSSRSEGVALTIVDPDVLDCPICFEELIPPIFQCYNGHIACSPCRPKVKDTCPSCKGTICYRNLAVEKIMESVKIPCPYASSGCDQLISYLNIDAHRNMCDYSPFHCPAADCTFEGPMREIYHHFVERHPGCSSSFQYNQRCFIGMCKFVRCHALHAQDGVIFLVLNKELEFGVGNAVMVVCLGPDSMEGKYTYNVRVSDQNLVCFVQLESPMSNIMRWEGVLPQKSFLLIPKVFHYIIVLEITIWNKVSTPNTTTQILSTLNTATQKVSTPNTANTTTQKVSTANTTTQTPTPNTASQKVSTPKTATQEPTPNAAITATPKVSTPNAATQMATPNAAIPKVSTSNTATQMPAPNVATQMPIPNTTTQTVSTPNTAAQAPTLNTATLKVLTPNTATQAPTPNTATLKVSTPNIASQVPTSNTTTQKVSTPSSMPSSGLQTKKISKRRTK